MRRIAQNCAELRKIAQGVTCAWNWSLSVRRMSSATSRPFDIACAARSSSEGPATERSAASPSSSDGGASASPAPLSTFIFLPDLSVRSPYTSVCRSVRATLRVASSHASMSCCSRPRGVTLYTKLRARYGSSPFRGSALMRKQIARLIVTVTLSCVLQSFTGMLKTTDCIVTRCETCTHGGPQW